MKINIKKFDDNAVIPTYGSDLAAGCDLYACIDLSVVIPPHETKLIRTGIGVEIPEGYAGLIYARSGLASKRHLAPANKVGVVDADYRGEIMIALHNHSNLAQSINRGDRIAQMVISPCPKVEFNEVEELSDTKRGNGSFGSSGR